MTAPGRRRLPMPPLEEWPRAGKLRIGEKVPARNKAGEAIERPAAIDYFRVDPEDGITSPESAASFHEVYGDRPREIACRLPGPTPEDCFEGAWRLYGTRKLKRVCDGASCDERTATGGWETKPCVCAARILPDNHKDRCKLTWTLNVILPDVKGMGVWQIDTGSEISVKRVSRWLQMMSVSAGDLTFLEFTLHLSPVDVTPDGRTKTVHVLDPRTVTSTPRELLAGGGRVLPELEAGAIPSPATPAPADDDPPDDDGPVVEGEIDPPTWQEVVEDIKRLAPDLDDDGIGKELARCFGRKVSAPELADSAMSGRAINYFLDRQEAQSRPHDDPEAAAGDPPPIPGQETLA